MSSPSSDETRSILAPAVDYAFRNPVKFVALATLVLTGAVPVGIFLVYAAGTVACTVVAAVVLDLGLLTLGVFGLAVALCFALCISGGVAGLFSVVYFGYRAALGSVNQARTRLAPSTVAASRLPSEEDSDTFDKSKHLLSDPRAAANDLLTGLVAFLDYLSSLTGQVRYSNTPTTANSTSGQTASDTEEWHSSDLWRTSLTVFVLAAAIFFMSYAVLVAAYVVIRFT